MACGRMKNTGVTQELVFNEWRFNAKNCTQMQVNLLGMWRGEEEEEERREGRGEGNRREEKEESPLYSLLSPPLSQLSSFLPFLSLSLW